MPTYQYNCNCGHCEEVFMTFSEHDKKKNKIKCPKCSKKMLQQYGFDRAVVWKTLGHMAEVNHDRLSEDEKEHIRRTTYNPHDNILLNPDKVKETQAKMERQIIERELRKSKAPLITIEKSKRFI